MASESSDGDGDGDGDGSAELRVDGVVVVAEEEVADEGALQDR
jgi:hypothetical protein